MKKEKGGGGHRMVVPPRRFKGAKETFHVVGRTWDLASGIRECYVLSHSHG